MKKMVLVFAFSVSLFAGSITCDIYLKKSIEKSTLLSFAIERKDVRETDRLLQSKVSYLERAIAACEGVLGQSSIVELKRQRSDLILVRKNLGF
jgi:hypothetical protein